MEWFVLFSARRLDLNVVSGPATMPCRRLLSPKPRPRELTPPVQVCEVRIASTSERCEAWDGAAQLACPVVGSKVIQQANEFFVYLFRRS